MIDTVLFDMDGLLLDTEPLWGESMLRVALKHKIPVTADKFKETTGLRIYEVTDYWAIKYPWQGAAAQLVADEILDDIIELSKQRGRVMPGVIKTLQLLKSNNYKTGLASSSPSRMIDELITHFDLKQYFDVITSADVVELGKPHPAVFLHAAKSLGSDPLNCVVLEDSINGLLAGKSARMKVIMVPDVLHFHKPEFMLGDAKLTSLEEFDLELLKAL
ncbi:MAG: hexitol phosphatase HxpB [Chitinophagales bacterium]|nr:hexitol phosphatase HxpB [Chitinophagales bacterium]